MNPADVLEATFFPLFHEAAARIAREYPSFRLGVHSFPVGTATTYQGHIVYLECMFPDALRHEADSVAASVGLKFLTTTPMFAELCVEWGNGDRPGVDVDLIEQPVLFSSDSLRDVVARFPELIAIFETALRTWISRHAKT